MNKEIRKVEEIIRGNGYHWVGNGFKVNQLLPAAVYGRDMRRYSPFLLMDYNAPTIFPGTEDEVGVGAHPHRGFETVTFAFEGKVEHHDNRGNHGVIEPGDVQWMTAGAGILHKEYHEKEYAKQDRPFHMLQLWVNLPIEHKMATPGYQALEANQMGTATIGDDGKDGEAIVVAGEAFGAKGPAHTFTPMNIYRLKVAPGKTVTVQEPENYHLLMLTIYGTATLNANETVKQGELAVFADEAGQVTITAGEEEAEFIVLSGKPINEPIVAAGPFVMNTQAEIRQAEKDFYDGKFGTWNF